MSWTQGNVEAFYFAWAFYFRLSLLNGIAREDVILVFSLKWLKFLWFEIKYQKSCHVQVS